MTREQMIEKIGFIYVPAYQKAWLSAIAAQLQADGETIARLMAERDELVSALELAVSNLQGYESGAIIKSALALIAKAKGTKP